MGHFLVNMNDNMKTFLSVMVDGWMRPFIIKDLGFLFLNHNQKLNYPNVHDQKLTYPGGFGLMTHRSCHSRVHGKRKNTFLWRTVLIE